MSLIDDDQLVAPTSIDSLRARPRGRDDRWQPSRAGLVALWRYWDETFDFHNGRLLLRGPNGSGKSMALELLLPFLLDGDASPHKLSSAAKSRGTLFDRVMAGSDESTRAGFAWIEFRRGDETFTVGARIRASRSTGRAERVLFTTSMPVGDGLDLPDADRGPISRKTLEEAIGTTGSVTDSASRHRDEIRRTLFPSFSADRYESLIGALLSLRREKLSQNLDLPKLSSVLPEALPPLDDHDIAEVAEGFERLDRRRADIATMHADLEQIDTLAQRQRRYARSVVAGVAGDVVAAESNRDGVVRNRRVAGDQLAEITDRLGVLDTEDRTLGHRAEEIAEELRGIRESDLYREGSRLAELRSDLDRRERDLEAEARSLEERARELHDAESERDHTETQLADADANLASAADEVVASAERVGAQSVVGDEPGATDVVPEERHRLVTAWVDDRHGSVATVRRLLADHRDAVRDRDGAESRLDDARRHADERHDEHAAAQTAVTREIDAFVDAVDAWSSDPVFGVDERDRITTARHGDDPTDAVDAACAAIASQRRQQTAVDRRDLEVRRGAIDDRRATLVAEQTPLRAGVLPSPSTPPWRRDRDGVAGAPLWRLVDIADAADDDTLAAVESAMVAAGLADAWITPSGEVTLGPDDPDVVLTAGVSVSGPALSSILTPAVDESSPVPAAVVTAVLDGIALVDDALASDGAVAIGRDGTFRLGSAAGRGPRTNAVLFGAAARERHRLAELDRLDGEIAECDRDLADVERADRALAAALVAFDAVLADRPDRGAVDAAVVALRDADIRMVEAGRQVEACSTDLARTEAAVRSTQRELATECSRTGLPADADDLDIYAAAIDVLRQRSETWLRRARERATALDAAARAAAAVGRAAQAHDDTARRHATVETDVTNLRTRAAAIESSLGQDYQALVERISTLESDEATTKRRLGELRRERPPLDRQLGTLEQQVQDAEVALAEAEASRQRTHGALDALVSGPLLTDAGIQVDESLDTLDGVTATLSAARLLAGTVSNDAADQVSRRSRQVDETLHNVRTAVAGRIELHREVLGESEWLGVTGVAGGLRQPISSIRSRLAAELDEARSELAADEAELFERTLAGSIRNSLADRIRAANQLVATINEQLDAVRTAAGVGVRLRWKVDEQQPPAVRAARSLLLRDPAGLTDDERASLQEFVRARVDEARQEAELHAPWEARLRDSLDYRKWHSFGLQVTRRDWQGFRNATPSLMQQLSTGERSVSLHLPMLASIAAHYSDGDGRPLPGPRLILLDELFAGVDLANRSQLFGTLSTWDLDAVFTSDHEWCQYATLDGIAIHHLQSSRDDEPATSVRFVWDGAERRLDDTQL